MITACTTHVIRSTFSKSEGEEYKGDSSGADNTVNTAETWLFTYFFFQSVNVTMVHKISLHCTFNIFSENIKVYCERLKLYAFIIIHGNEIKYV